MNTYTKAGTHTIAGLAFRGSTYALTSESTVMAGTMWAGLYEGISAEYFSAVIKART